MDSPSDESSQSESPGWVIAIAGVNMPHPKVRQNDCRGLHPAESTRKPPPPEDGSLPCRAEPSRAAPCQAAPSHAEPRHKPHRSEARHCPGIEPGMSHQTSAAPEGALPCPATPRPAMPRPATPCQAEPSRKPHRSEAKRPPGIEPGHARQGDATTRRWFPAKPRRAAPRRAKPRQAQPSLAAPCPALASDLHPQEGCRDTTISMTAKPLEQPLHTRRITGRPPRMDRSLTELEPWPQCGQRIALVMTAGAASTGSAQHRVPCGLPLS